MRILSRIVLVLAALALTSCGTDEQRKVLRVGHTLDSEHAVHKALLHLSERLEHYSDGAMALKIYPNGQLGSEREMVELLQIGSLAMTKVSAAVLESFVPDMKVFSVPYIFHNRNHRWRVLQSDIGEDILQSLDSAHLTGLGYFDAGSRSFYLCETLVQSPADVVGKKVRVMNSQTSVRMIAAFGGAATPIAWGELYAALQQGVVDGAENNPPTYFLSRHYEICPYYSINEHTSVPDVVVSSKYVMQSLTLLEQQWLRLAMSDAVELQKKLWLESEEKSLAAVREAGVEVIFPDKQPFLDAVAPFHASFSNTLVGDYIERIAAMYVVPGDPDG